MSAQSNGRPAIASAGDARFYDLIAQAPVAMSVLRGPNLVLEATNAAMLRIVGRGEEIIGKPVLESFPEVAGQAVWKMMQSVYLTGAPVQMDEVPVTLLQDGSLQEGFYNISYTPLVEAGAVVGILQAVTDVTAQVRARRAGEEQAAFLQNAIDIGELGTFSVDVATRHGAFSENVRDWLGLAFPEGPLDAIFSRIHPDDRARVEAAMNHAMASDADARHDITYRVADTAGTAPRYLRSIGKALFADGVAHTITGIIQDVTAQRATDESLNYRQALLEAQNEAIPDAILIVDTKGGMISFNRHFAEVWGIPADIMARKDDAAALEFAMGQLSDPQAFIAGVNYCYTFPDETHDHTEMLFKDGRTIERWGNPVTGADGMRYGWAWYFRDVTARKAVERELMLKERAISSSDNGIVITRAGEEASPIVYVNPAFERMTGYRADEAIGRDCRFLQASDRNQPDLDLLRDAIREGRPCMVVLRNYKKDGTLFYNELSLSPVYEEGKLVHFIGLQNDITQRREMVIALRQSEQRFRSIFNGQFLFLAILAPDGTVMDVNELPLQAGGSRREDVVGKLFWDTVWWRRLPEMRAGWPLRLEQAAASDGPVFSEDRFQTADGETRVADAAVTAVRDAEGAVEFFIVQASDITDRKKVEQALRASEDRYQTFVRQSSEGIWRFEISVPVPTDLPLPEQLDRIFQHAYLAECNDAMAQMYGYERADELHGAHITDFMPRNAENEAYLTHFIRSGYRVADAESHEKDRDGEDRYFLNNLLGIIEDGKIQRAWGTQRDITEQRAAEEKLRESEAQFRDFSNNIQNLAWIADADGYIFWYNRRWYEYTGTTLEEMQGWGWEKVQHPEHIGRVVEFVREAWTRDEPYELTFPLRRKDGEYRWFLTRVEPVFDETGKRTRWIGTNTDIHEQVTAQKELEESALFTRNIIEHSPVAKAVYIGPEFTIQTVNKRMLDSMGRDASIVGKNYFNVLSELRGTVIEERLRRVWATGETFHTDEERVEHNRHDKPYTGYYSFTFKALRNTEGEVYGVMDTSVEVTAQVTARKNAEDSEARFRSLIEEAPVATCLFMGRGLRVEVANDAMLNLWGKATDILGKPLEEALPELEGQPFLKILDNVFTTGVAYQAAAMPCVLVRDGVSGTYYFDFTYKPLRDATAKVYGILDMAVDVTEQVLAHRRVEESQRQLLSLFEQSPVGIALIGADEGLTFEMANAFYSAMVGRTSEDIVGKPLLEALPEIRGQGFDDLLRGVLSTGKAYIANEVPVNLNRGGDIETIYVDLAYQPRTDASGAVTGILVVATDITSQVEARRQVEEREAYFRRMTDTVPAIIWETRPDGYCTYLNRNWYSYTGQTEHEAEGFGWLDATHPDDKERTGKMFVEANAAQKPFHALYRLRSASGEYRWAVDSGQPRFAADGTYEGIIGTVVDVHEQQLAEEKIRASEVRFRSLIEASPVAIGLFVGRDLVIENPNQTFIDIVGKGWDIVGKPLREAMPELVSEGQPFLTILDDVFTTGMPFETPGSLVKILRDGVMTENYYNITYTPLLDEAGELYAILDVAVDVTEQITAQQKVEEAEAALRSAIELAELATWEVDAATGRGECSDRLRDWIGVEDGEEVLGAFMQAVHPDDQARVASALQRAIGPDSNGSYDEEYRLVNRLNGRQRIVHAQGKSAVAAANNGVRISGTAQDVTRERALQAELERQVQERTAELADAARALTRSNEELSQYAYVASHDLQEPLRKIQMFSGILDKQESISEATKTLVGRISGAAERMSTLIQSLLEFSRLQKGDGALMRPVDLSAVVRDVVQDFELMIAERAATVEMGELPVVEGVGLQMNQLFYNLVGNALKFARPDAAPEIRIAARTVPAAEADDRLDGPPTAGQYHHIIVSDNGIGFEVRYAEHIFEVFKRLHGRDAYPGSGIGLALCRRIVANHGGALWAESEVGKGSTFNILLPEAGLHS